MTERKVRIGGASGYWGESTMATPQLLSAGRLDYLVYDYLAEITMSIMARARAKDPGSGFATDFVSGVLKPNLKTIAEQGVKVISNAGGVNPSACGAAIRALIRDQGLDLKVAVIEGDDLVPKSDAISKLEIKEMFSGEDMPPVENVASINAYLGAFPIARALDLGADIVITGRCVDSAVTLGACIHEFNWQPEEYDKLANGSLAGHILECGPQATGGNYTDWDQVVDTILDIGYPIAAIASDGSFSITKPDNTGGTVSVGSVSEQLLYEIGDPQAYMLPDVVCDFSNVTVLQHGVDIVHVAGAKGSPPPKTYKASLTYQNGFRGGTMVTFYGLDADKKAAAFADAVFGRARRTLRALNAADYTETSVELIGADSQFGVVAEKHEIREVAAKIAAKHEDALGIGVLLKELTGLGLATPPGLSGFAGGRAKPSPLVQLFSFAAPKNLVSITIDIDGAVEPFSEPGGGPGPLQEIVRPADPVQPALSEEMVCVPLIKLAWGRSGDKGDKANVGIIARDQSYLPYIWEALTIEEVEKRFAHFLKGPVERFFMPGPNAINFLLHDVLGGGGVASIRNDAQGKGYAQLVLSAPIPIPKSIAETLR